MRYKELILAATMFMGFLAAEIPDNVKDYTQTASKYSMDNYGGGIAASQAVQLGKHVEEVTG